MPGLAFTTSVDLSRLAAGLADEIRGHVRKGLARAAADVVAPVAAAVEQGLVASPEYQSMLSGKLPGEFGLADPATVLPGVAKAVGRSVTVQTRAGAGEDLGGLTVSAMRADFRDALSADGARYVSHNRQGQDHAVEWLEWLLFAGDRVVIADYGVATGPFDRYSRTGTHLMLKTREKGRVQPWRVPPEFAGTASGNSLTRVADAARPQVLAAVDATLRRVFA